MDKYRLNSTNGEMEKCTDGEWVHVEDIPRDSVRDKLWVDVYLEQSRGKYPRQAVLLANNAVKDYDERT